MWSGAIEQKNSDRALKHGDLLNPVIRFQNETDQAMKIRINVSLRINGQMSDPEWPGVDILHTVNPGGKSVNLLPQALEINRELGLAPGVYDFIATFKNETLRQEQFDSVNLNIEPRIIHPVGSRLTKIGNEIKKWLVYGHYGMICGCNAGQGSYLPTFSDLNNAITQIKSYWPGQLGFRCWTMSGETPLASHNPFKLIGDNFFDLEQWNDAYLNRIKLFTDVMRNNDVLCILDLFDHYTMYKAEIWQDHPLNPSRNAQATYGLPSAANSAFPFWYDLQSYPDSAQFQRRYVQKIASMLKTNDWVIFSSGNEMRDGNDEIRKSWHRQIGKWIKEVNPCAIFSENDHGHLKNIHELDVVDFIEVHSCGGLSCNGNGWSGKIPCSEFAAYKKPVLFDNDGLWRCRDYNCGENAVEWWNLVKQCNGYYGAKGPFPHDPRWSAWGKPFLQSINQNY